MRPAKILLILVCGAFSAAGIAGTRQEFTLTVRPAEGWAGGAMTQARSLGFFRGRNLGCEISNRDGTVNCVAADYDPAVNGGDAMQCATSVAAFPSFAKNVRAINNASAVLLYFDPATGICTDLVLIQGSQFLSDQLHGLPAPAKSNIVIGSGYARGFLSGVRYNDTNPNEFISCDVHATGLVHCVARDNAGSVAECFTTESANPSFAEAARAIDAISYVGFVFGSTGVCSKLFLRKDASSLP